MDSITTRKVAFGLARKATAGLNKLLRPQVAHTMAVAKAQAAARVQRALDAAAYQAKNVEVGTQRLRENLRQEVPSVTKGVPPTLDFSSREALEASLVHPLRNSAFATPEKLSRRYFDNIESLHAGKSIFNISPETKPFRDAIGSYSVLADR